MFKRVILIIILAISISLSGCTVTPADISMLEIVQVLGIDDVDGQIKLTAVLKIVLPVGEGQGESQVNIYTAYGETVFDAVRNMHAYTDREVFFGHMDFIMIGEETAKKGVNKYLDFFVRDHEVKQNTKLLVTQDMTAEEFIKTTNLQGRSISDVLESLFTDIDALSQSSQITILDYMQLCSCKKDALYIPTVKAVDYLEKSEEEADKKNAELGGYALFNVDTLVGFLGNNKARGMNWIIDEMGTGIIVIEDSDGNKISMEIIVNRPKIEVDYSADIPTAKIVIDFETNIGEYQGIQDIFTSTNIDYIIEEQNKVIKKEIEETVDYLQGVGTDTIGVTNKIYHRYPKKTTDYSGPLWREIFMKMDITVEVKSIVNRTYNINQPIEYRKTKKGND